MQAEWRLTGQARSHGGGVDGTLQLILAELRMIRTESAEERAEMAKIRAECDELRVTQQQHFMEQLDSRDRERNLIITGLPEEEAFDGTVKDQGKYRKGNGGYWRRGCVLESDSGHNGHKPKQPKPKRPQTKMATNRNGHRPEWPQTETATDPNGHKPKRPQSVTATNRNGHK